LKILFFFLFVCYLVLFSETGSVYVPQAALEFSM
jgi:hypothetical protein